MYSLTRFDCSAQVSYLSCSGNRGGWSTEGCNLTSNAEDFVVCECDHLTSFSMLLVSQYVCTLCVFLYNRDVMVDIASKLPSIISSSKIMHVLTVSTHVLIRNTCTHTCTQACTNVRMHECTHKFTHPCMHAHVHSGTCHTQDCILVSCIMHV